MENIYNSNTHRIYTDPFNCKGDFIKNIFSSLCRKVIGRFSILARVGFDKQFLEQKVSLEDKDSSVVSGNIGKQHNLLQAN